MPATYNGIGTHYYGKRNQEKRVANCQQCGRRVELSSYDTRLWFVIFFIPIVPLGRKRIVDQCEACTRHYVLNLEKWETAKQLEISGALEEFRSRPSPESAIAAHQTLVNFHQLAQAAEFRQMLEAKFADNAKVQAYLGGVLEHLGQLEAATAAFRRALDLRPDLPEARVGMARAHMNANRLKEARDLLDFLEKPGASQLYSLEPLEMLAHHFKTEGRFEEALQLFARLLEAYPTVADHGGFRKSVEEAEKALKRTTSILPARKFSWKRFFSPNAATSGGAGPQVTWRGLAWVGGAMALLLLAGILRNEYVRRHRTLRIINVLPQTATVAIDQAAPIRVANGTAETILPEGRHHASINGPAPEELDFELRSGFFDRWFNDPVWVLNIGGAAVLVQTRATYSQNPQPPTFSFHFGQTFHSFPDISHPFTPLPESLRMKSHESRTLTHLDLHPGKATEVFQYFGSQRSWSEALRLAETRLRFQPGDDAMLHHYLSAIVDQKQQDRAETFLKEGLTNRPIRMDWHRAYQNLRKDRTRDARLAAEYDALLQTDPRNSDLLYLRGRVANTRADARRYFEQSTAANPQNPYPVYAQGFERSAQGDWPAAKQLFQKAVELSPGQSLFKESLARARFALGEYRELEQEARDLLKRDPENVATTIRLVDTLVAGSRPDEASQTIAQFERRMVNRHGDAGRDVSSYLRRRLLYLTGNFAGLEKDLARDQSPGGRALLFQSLIEQGKVSEALQARPRETQDSSQLPFFDLIIALAWHLQSNETEAMRWEQSAIQRLEVGDTDDAIAAAMLKKAGAPETAELEDVILTSEHKAILLACLAQRHPSRREDLARAARRLNIDRDFPHHLIQRATMAAAEKQ